MAAVASNRWHKLNNAVCEIERQIEKLIIAKDHCQRHRNSLAKEHICKIESTVETLYQEAEMISREWREKIEGDQCTNLQYRIS